MAKSAKAKKNIWIGVCAIVLVAAVIAGCLIVPRLPKDEVFVYSFDMVGYMNTYYGGSESSGMVTTDRVQTEYVTDTMVVTEILVYPGQEVKKGDLLYRYDTTLSDLVLERKDLELAQMEINLKNAQAELRQLNAMVPMVVPDEILNPTEPTVPAEDIAPESETMLNQVLGGSGTLASDPKRVWLSHDYEITEDDIERYLDGNVYVYVLFQMTEEDKPGVEFSEEFGIRYAKKPVLITPDAPADPSDPTDPSDPVGTTDPSDPAGNTDTTDPSDPGEPADPTNPTDSTDPTDPAGGDGGAGDQIFETRTYFAMSFFDPVDLTEDVVVPEIQWNSGYTQAELTSMRSAKAQQIKDLEFNLKIGRAELEIMRKEAADGNAVAKFDGVVVSVLEPENALSLNAPMIKVNGGGGFYVEGAVSELDLATIQVGQKVTVTSWDTYATYEGVVADVGNYPVEDEYYYYSATNVSYYPYRVFIDQSADLQDGYYVSMIYQSEPQSEEGIMYLENSFIRTENGESYVYVRGEDGTLEKRIVQLGENDGYMSQVRSGLAQTDFLAFPYGKEVKQGAPTVEGTWEDLYGY